MYPVQQRLTATSIIGVAGAIFGVAVGLLLSNPSDQRLGVAAAREFWGADTTKDSDGNNNCGYCDTPLYRCCTCTNEGSTPKSVKGSATPGYEPNGETMDCGNEVLCITYCNTAGVACPADGSTNPVGQCAYFEKIKKQTPRP